MTTSHPTDTHTSDIRSDSTLTGDAASSPESKPHTAPSTEKEANVFVASQTQLIWWKFRRHRLALFSGVVVLFIYLIIVPFVEFWAPYDPHDTRSNYTYGSPQRLYLIDTDDGFRIGPYVYGFTSTVDPASMRREFTVDREQKYRIRFLAEGFEYKLLGLIPTNRHFFGSSDPDHPVYVMGADRLGRDMFSRIVYGARNSMMIGLAGVFISLTLGVIIGGISGYYGGLTDNLIQRMIDLLKSLPTIPLWLGLAAALPLEWPPTRVYFAITVILSLIGWTGMARVVRGRFLALREEDYVIAARLDGVDRMSLILQHMLPAMTSHIIASVTLAIPHMILAETSLSFLQVGLRPPVISWGVLLQEAQSLRVVSSAPWLLLPAVAVIIAVLSLNFLGDGLRDAADPYG